jgi:hypothetical protein
MADRTPVASRGCNLPSFSPEAFGVPRRLRNKYLAFVGDYFGASFSQLQFCAKLLGIFEPFHSLW